ncbi:MAG: hypothetical protein P4L50_14420 [Anaerolineaceae bacterium]|nr:hypothetical protein [Anaerolineaceae bacterium]
MPAFARTGGMPIRFVFGVPDFAPYASDIVINGIRLPSVIKVENLTGEGDRALTIRELSTKTGVSQTENDVVLRKGDIQIHHYLENEMQLVPKDLNGTVYHSGPASALRKGYSPLGESFGVGLKTLGVLGLISALQDPGSLAAMPMGGETTLADATVTGLISRNESILANPTGIERSSVQYALNYLHTGYEFGSLDSQGALQLYMSYQAMNNIQAGQVNSTAFNITPVYNFYYSGFDF